MSICFAGCLSPGPRKNDLTIYWALGPFVRSFTLLVDPGDNYPPQSMSKTFSSMVLEGVATFLVVEEGVAKTPTARRSE
jgi:hypothetical protein